MDTGHDPLTSTVEQHRTLTAHGFRHQGLLPPGLGSAPHHGGVELDELQVADRQSGPERHGDAVAGDRRRVRRRCEHLPVPAACDDHGTGGDRADRRDRSVLIGTGHAYPGDLTFSGDGPAHHQIEGERVVHHVDAGTDRRFVEGALHLCARPITSRVHDAVVAVATFSGEGDVQVETGAGLCGVVGIERGTEAHQVPDRRRCFVDELSDDFFVAQPGTCRQRVSDVVLGRVGGVEHGGKPALGPLCGPGFEHVLGDDEHRPNRSDGQRRRQSGGTGAEHDDVDVALPGGRRRLQSSRQSHPVSLPRVT